MRVVITGATGNVGTALVRALASDGSVDEIIGIARRPAPPGYPITRFAQLDLSRGRPRGAFAGADAVVHLAWEIQPSRDRARLWRTNVLGTRRVLDAVVATGVPRLVVASSIGVYSKGPKDRLVDESWPRSGIPSSTYSVHKAAAERLLDALEARGSRAAGRAHATGPDLPASVGERAAPALRRATRAGRLLRCGRLPLVPRRPGSPLPGRACR